VKPVDLDAYVLCGGSGTRLRPAVADLPKPLAPIEGRPFLDVLLGWLRQQGVGRFVLCAGFRAEAIEASLPWLRTHGEVALSTEDEPLGTGGALRNALAHGSSDPMLALNGDSICPLDVGAMLTSHLESGAFLTLAVARAPTLTDFGSVEIAADGRVSAFAEKCPDSRGGLANAGVYLLDREHFAATAPAGRFSLETDLFPRLAVEGLVRAWQHDGSFVDIGTPDRYREAGDTLRELGLL